MEKVSYATAFHSIRQLFATSYSPVLSGSVGKVTTSSCQETQLWWQGYL
jgi:hypothetical protein